MKDFLIPLFVLVALGWLTSLFFGSIWSVQRSFKAQPLVNKQEMRQIQDQQKSTIRETQQKQKLLMEDLKQRMRDSQRR